VSIEAKHYCVKDLLDCGAVLPVGGNKKPLCSRGVRDAKVRSAWNGHWPKNAKTGIACGPMPGTDGRSLVVFDVDGPAGQASYDALSLPKTATFKTSRGQHYYFLVPGVVENKKLKELDVLGPRKYALVREEQDLGQEVTVLRAMPNLGNRAAQPCARATVLPPDGRDDSRSGRAFAMIKRLLRKGASDRTIVMNLLEDQGAIGEWAREREFDHLRNDLEKGKLELLTEGPANLRRVFEAIPTGLLGKSALTDSPYLLNEPVWGRPGTPRTGDWRNEDTLALQLWLQINGIAASKSTVEDAVALAAAHYPFHPVALWLDSLPAWGGKQLISFWLQMATNAEDTPYVRTVARKWLIAAVARAMQPGCQADNMLILEGEQGTGKTSLLRILAVREEWFNGDMPSIRDKDALMEAKVSWICLFDEMHELTHSEQGLIKQFITQTSDTYRASYDRRPSTHLRSCIFAGTRNPDGTGCCTDPSGARRFWPVLTGNQPFDLEWARSNRDQLWAEALHAWRSGERHWLTHEEQKTLAEPEQAQRYQPDAWQEVLEGRLMDTTETTAPACYGMLGLDIAKVAKPEANRVARCLKMLGFERKKARRDGKPCWVWVRQ
jgi:Virulence-associated protein E/Bifunctional DNA primase/polymerase, N-terminal